MKNSAKISVIIPALNEERSIGKVLAAIPDWADEIVVVDNGSTDRTAELARARGARVVPEPRRGYGAACWAGMQALDDPEVVVFLDGDFSDYPEEMEELVEPITTGTADLVIGSRVLGHREPGALPLQARFGNWLACHLMGLFWKTRMTDLGPFRAIRASSLFALDMQDRDYGWTVEMQIKATCRGIRIREVPVSYRRRLGRSKISGTVRGVWGASVKILSTIFLMAWKSSRPPQKFCEKVLIFTRYPEPGKTKTRLISVLGSHGAANLQRQMTELTLHRVRELSKRRSVSVEVRYEGGNKNLVSQWLGSEGTYRSQGQGDLGVRLARAFQDAFAFGAERVVIIGSDCPGLTVEHLRTSFEALRQNDVVVGPAQDGGYYLIGLRKFFPEMFSGIAWGTPEVWAQTRSIIERLGLSAVLLEPLGDVDRPEDLLTWEKERTSVA